MGYICEGRKKKIRKYCKILDIKHKYWVYIYLRRKENIAKIFGIKDKYYRDNEKFKE